LYAQKSTRRLPIAAAVPGEHGPDSTFSRVHWAAPATMKRRVQTYRRNDGTGADPGGKHSRINRPTGESRRQKALFYRLLHGLFTTSGGSAALFFSR
jgi:hypothetical protein